MAIHDFLIQSGAGEVFPGPLNVQFDRNNLVLPDLFVVGSARSDVIHENGVMGAPDLCIEILSPGWRNYDFVKKNVLYSEFGVPEYWIVDSDRKRIAVQVRGTSRYSLWESEDGMARSLIFPGLEFDPSGIASPPPSATPTSKAGKV